MLKFVFLLSAVACALGAAIPEGMLPQLDGRIVGGNVAAADAYPYHGSLQRSGFHSCSCAIYSTKILLTAAHCTQAAIVSNYKVRVGTNNWNSGGVLASVAEILNNEDYYLPPRANDIAAIVLRELLTLSPTIQPIALASSDPAVGAAAVNSGYDITSWGSTTDSPALRYVELEIVSRAQCAAKYDDVIYSSMICATNESCLRDSGGPLASGGVLVGIQSWGYGCDYPTQPLVFSDIAYLKPWVEDVSSSLTNLY